MKHLEFFIGWPALGDGYCNVGRRRSWTWIKLVGARSVMLRTILTPSPHQLPSHAGSIRQSGEEGSKEFKGAMARAGPPAREPRNVICGSGR